MSGVNVERGRQVPDQHEGGDQPHGRSEDFLQLGRRQAVAERTATGHAAETADEKTSGQPPGPVGPVGQRGRDPSERDQKDDDQRGGDGAVQPHAGDVEQRRYDDKTAADTKEAGQHPGEAAGGEEPEVAAPAGSDRTRTGRRDDVSPAAPQARPDKQHEQRKRTEQNGRRQLPTDPRPRRCQHHTGRGKNQSRHPIDLGPAQPKSRSEAGGQPDNAQTESDGGRRSQTERIDQERHRENRSAATGQTQRHPHHQAGN